MSYGLAIYILVWFWRFFSRVWRFCWNRSNWYKIYDLPLFLLSSLMCLWINVAISNRY